MITCTHFVSTSECLRSNKYLLYVNINTKLSLLNARLRDIVWSQQSDFQSGVDKQKNQLTLHLMGQNLDFEIKAGNGTLSSL